jgi:hypothetical protein
LINSRVIPNSPHLPFEIFSCLISRSYDLLFCAKPDINLMGDCINGTIHMPLCVAKNSKNSAEFATEVTRKTTFYRILDHAKNKMQKIRVFFVWQMWLRKPFRTCVAGYASENPVFRGAGV